MAFVRTDEFNVGQLKTDNYWSWADRMQGLLVKKEIDDFLYRDSSNEDWGGYEDGLDRVALCLIRAHVSDPLLPSIRGHKRAKDAWDALRMMHGKVLAAWRPLLEGQFANLRKRDNESVQEYYARAEDIRWMLKHNDDPREVDDEELCKAILQGLPREYGPAKPLLSLHNSLATTPSAHLLGGRDKIPPPSSKKISLPEFVASLQAAEAQLPQKRS